MPFLIDQIRFRDYLALSKPRPAILVLVTVAVGFVLGSAGALDGWLLCSSLLGVALVAGGTGALNQWLERELDAKMVRTQNRPLPAGRLNERQAFWFGAVCCVLGVVTLWLLVNPAAAVLGALTAGIYICLYTPSKVRTTANTLVGAVAGALPPVIGWAAASGRIVEEAWYLFAITFLWQLPHFFSISWFYREDYARAGMKMLGVVDPGGRLMLRQLILYSLLLIVVSMVPALTGFVGLAYSAAALILGITFLVCGILFVLHQSAITARRLFLASLVYLPGLFGLMVLDRMGLV